MSSKGGLTSMCLVCASPVEQAATGRWRDYCSPGCRQYAYRQRHAAARWAAQRSLRSLS